MKFVVESDNTDAKIELYLERDGDDIDVMGVPVGGSKEDDSECIISFRGGRFIRYSGVSLKGIEIDDNERILETG